VQLAAAEGDSTELPSSRPNVGRVYFLFGPDYEARAFLGRALWIPLWHDRISPLECPQGAMAPPGGALQVFRKVLEWPSAMDDGPERRQIRQSQAGKAGIETHP